MLFILADDLGWADLSVYGQTEYETPHLDRLAAQGVRFTQAYANLAVCSATRFALMTGRYQYRTTAVAHPLPKGHPVNAIAIAQEISWHLLPGKCFDDLLRRPLCCGVLRDVEVHHTAALVGQNQEDE